MPLTADAFRRLLATPGTVWLDTARPDAENHRQLLFAHPEETIVARTPEAVPEALQAMDAALANGRWCAGVIAYEAGYGLEAVGAPPGVEGGPLVWLGVYDAPTPLPDPTVRALLEAQMRRPAAVTDPALMIARTRYRAAFDAVQARIRAGDVYQINLTDRFAFGVDGDPLALYGALRQRQPVAYGAFLHLDAGHLLSFSPELFVRRDGAHVVARPMKGTVRRGDTPEEDAALRDWLAADAKSQAENLMIVDLLRNDLSVCCMPGTVRVPHLFATEPYEMLFQMTSTVEGRLREGVTTAGLLRALFPCGSVTGAPKIRAMQIIRSLEPRARGAYCGAIGFAAPDGRAVFNVAIRTLCLQGGRGTMGTGSGLVWDSDAEAEYDEWRLKGAFLAEAGAPFELIETMRAEDGAVPLLDLHADRLARSARVLGFAFDETAFRQRVAAAAGTDPYGQCPYGQRPHVVRTTLARDGALTLTTRNLPEEPPRFRRVLLAHARVSTTDPWLGHKTTHRAFYERTFRHAGAAGYDEVLFCNEHGAVAEGSRTSVFAEVDGALRTPPVTAGALPGVYRQHLLRSHPHAHATTLTPADLRRADAVYLCNAVHGLVRVEHLILNPDEPIV